MAMHEYQKQAYKKVGVIVALIILPIAGVFAGTQYQRQTGSANTAGTNAQRFGGGAAFRGRAIGTVKSISATNINVTERRGNTDKTYMIDSNTMYKNGTADAAAADIKTGDTVLLTLDSSDSSKVKTITINPTMARPLGDDQTQSSGDNAMLQ
jgi:hypothetical protein